MGNVTRLPGLQAVASGLSCDGHSHAGRRRLLLAPLLAAALAAAPPGPEPADELKAAAVLSFLRFAEWNVPLREPVVVGLFGRTQFHLTAMRVLAGRQVGTHPVHVRALRKPSEARDCHLVFLATTNAADIRTVVDQVRGLPVLLLGEAEGFLEQGGAARLQFRDGRLAFEVSRRALDAAGIPISSKLLRFGQAPAGKRPEARP